MSEEPNLEIESSAVESSDYSESVDSPSTEGSSVETADSTTEAPKQSDRAVNRFQQLANNYKTAQVENSALRKQLEDYQKSREQSYAPSENVKLNAEDLTTEELERYIVSKADQIVNLRLQQESKARHFEKSIATIESKYMELNPDSENFDVNLSNTVTDLYAKASRVNPDVDILDFVDGIMGVRNYGADKAVSNVKKETILQEANSAITPSSEKVETLTKEEELIQMLKSGKLTAKEAEKFLQS